MKTYSTEISLLRNSRGVYCLDPIKGCASGMAATAGGCYGDCYAARSAKLYGYNFAVSVRRMFRNSAHLSMVVRAIERSDSTFIRMGCSGDPSEDWSHTLDILRMLDGCNREIVIITRHWRALTDGQLKEMGHMNITFNTSVSAIDGPGALRNSLEQHARTQQHCRSVLRVVTADFNTDSERGAALAETQRRLLRMAPVIDTVLRVGKAHPLVAAGVVRVSRELFNGRRVWASKFNKRTFMGKCSACQENCGASVDVGRKYAARRGISMQMQLNRQPTEA